MALYTQTTELPVFLGAPHKPNLIIAANIQAGGSLAIQYAVGATWITAETFTTSFVREINCSAHKIRILVTGTVSFEVND